jgi:hypothetical protein
VSIEKNLRATWSIFVLAALTVAGSGVFAGVKLARRGFVDCRGRLEAVSPSELSETRLRPSPASDLVLRYDERGAAGARTYHDVRVAWARPDGAQTCSDVPLPWDAKLASTPGALEIGRDDATGLFAIVPPGDSKPLAVFRRAEGRGRRLDGDRLIGGHGVALLVFVVSLGALALAVGRLRRAYGYAAQTHAWRPAVVRADGLVVEGERTLGRLAAEDVDALPPGAVLVDPAALAPDNGYRDALVLRRRDLRIGTHETWAAGATRRLRDARVLAAVAMATTAATVLAHVLAA